MMLSSYGGPRIRLHVARTFDRRTTGPPHQRVLMDELTARPRGTAIVAVPRGLAERRVSGTVARRSGCPSRARRPVPRTDHSARDGHLRARNPGTRGTPTPPYR